MLGGPFRPDWGEHESVWDAYRLTCDPSTHARRLFDPISPSPSPRSSNTLASGFNFITHIPDTTIDFCHAPWAHYTQGHFFSDWRTIPALYPLFSSAKAVGFFDVRIPSHYYYGMNPQYTYGYKPGRKKKPHKMDPWEISWEKKQDKFFWRGASTGGGGHPSGFAHQYQRHR
jgi:hypothetical protein